MTHAGPLHPPGQQATALGRIEGGWVGQVFSAQSYQVSLALLLAQPQLQALPTQQYALQRNALYLFPSYKLHMHTSDV